MRLLATLLLAVGLALAGCSTDDASEGASEGVADAPSDGPTARASATAAPSPAQPAEPTPDPTGTAEGVTEQSDLGIALGELPLPPGSAPMGQAVSEGSTVSETFTVQGIRSASEVLDDAYLQDLQDDGWEISEDVSERGDGVAATLTREDLELMLVAQDGPADDPENAVLNVVINRVT